jgi:hypothetical protein
MRLKASGPKEGADEEVGRRQHENQPTKKEGRTPSKLEEMLAPTRRSAICQDEYSCHRHVPSEKKKWLYSCRLLGMSSLKKGAM